MTTFLTRLDGLATLAFEGPDSRTFLQGQTTCDIGSLSETHSVTGACCNPQGRMIFDFRLWQLSPAHILATVQADVAQIAVDTFGKYIVFSKARVRDATADWAHYAIWGSGAAALARAPAATGNACWQQGPVTWCALDRPQAFTACVASADADSFEAGLAAAEPVPADRFIEREIRAGIGHVGSASSGIFLPQELNYQLTGRVSFSKGCYTGQEVVARLHYRGKVKRPMLLASVAGANPPRPGDKIYRKDSDQAVGSVINAVATDSDSLLLASVSREAAAEGACLERGGSPLEFLDLPYALADD